MFEDARLWSFVADMNGDGGVTISDVWLWFKWLYFYPGDGILYGVMNATPNLAKFLELSAQSFGSVASGAFSFVVWFIAFIFYALIADS